MSRSVQLRAMRADARAIFDAAVHAADPYHIVRRALRVDAVTNTLVVDAVVANDRKSALSFSLIDTVVTVIGLGKASLSMTAAAIETLAGHVTSSDCLAITAHQSPLSAANEQLLNGVRVIRSAHPIPDENSIVAGQMVRELVSRKTATRNHLVVVLLSGGASSLCELPVDGITLADLQTCYTTLLHSGADIAAINAVRKRISRVKGGGLVRMTDSNSTVVSLALSDVIGDDLSTIGSAPTVIENSMRTAAIRVIERLHLRAALPFSVLAAIDRVDGSGDSDSDSARRTVHNIIVGSSLLSLLAARAEAGRRGYHSLALTDRLQGEVSSMAQLYQSLASSIATVGLPVRLPACLLTAGETTVTVRVADRLQLGKGGRNQHMALVVAQLLSSVTSASDVVFLSAGTDGRDGDSDAAGAIVDQLTQQSCLSYSLDIEDAIRRFDSNGVLTALDRADGNDASLIVTGLTGTNVQDIAMLLVR